MDWLSLLPPIVAIVVAIWKREVILALIIALWLSETFMAGFNPALGFLAVLDRIVAVFQDVSNTQVLLFGLLVGALLALLRESGGVAAFTDRLIHRGFARTPRQAQLLPTVVGTSIFIDTNLSILTAGTVSQKLFDKFKMSRARLAFFLDSTCAPVSVIILLNGWGAYILGLIHSYDVGNPVRVLVTSIGFNFYPLLILATVFFTAITGRVFGSMRCSEIKAQAIGLPEQEIAPSKARYMVVPVVLLVGGMLFFMYYTGEGNLLQGAGAKSVLWAVALATCCCALMLLFDKVFNIHEITKVSFKGMSDLLPVVSIVMLSMALGASLMALGTGDFIAGTLGPYLPFSLIAPLLFITASLMSFTTGTSWGTFAILIPVALPLGEAVGLPPAFVLAAVLGGGVFGDHCSPISDSTIISSLASGCDHLEHVKTQMPYALVMGGVSAILYWLISFALV